MSENIFEDLTGADLEITEMISEICPFMDKKMEKRLLSKIERKVKLHTENSEYEVSVSGVERYVKPPFYKNIIKAAAAVIIILGIAGGAYSAGRNGISRDKSTERPTAASHEKISESSKEFYIGDAKATASVSIVDHYCVEASTSCYDSCINYLFVRVTAVTDEMNFSDMGYIDKPGIITKTIYNSNVTGAEAYHYGEAKSGEWTGYTTSQAY